ncbi:biotin/methionine sulfoxide reductase [Mycobacteroides chelonae]|nr:biotin/methionine sulfoxide reductase [Mycobacteroides chelonae]
MTRPAFSALHARGSSRLSHTHWGAFTPEVYDGEVVGVTPLATDQDPSPLLQNIPGSIRHQARVAAPSVRRGWLRDGPGPSTSSRPGRGSILSTRLIPIHPAHMETRMS